MSVTIILASCLIMILIKIICKKPANFPPGPPAIPILGSTPFLFGKGVEKFVSDKIASYGPVTGLYAGSYPFIMINDWKLAKSLFLTEEFSGRVNNYFTNWERCTDGVSLGVVFTEGARWTSQRNFIVKQLKSFGFGKKSLETVIWKEAKDIVEYILSLDDHLTIDSSLFSLPPLNVLWSMVAGQPFSRDDAEIKELLELNTFAFSSKSFMIALHAPWVRHVLPSLSGYSKMLSAVRGTKEKIREQIIEHEKVLDIDNPRDFIDMYLIEMKNNPDPEFNLEQLVMIGHDLMSAGSETVATTMNWVILFLALYPEVQEKCYQEILALGIQLDGSLTLTDKLNYCKATIAEVQRVSEVAVSSVQHRVIREVTLPTGHVIPEGTIAMTNIKKFLSDPKLWDRPELFLPQR